MRDNPLTGPVLAETTPTTRRGATLSTTDPVRPSLEERYGRRPTPGRRRAGVLIGAGAAVLAIAWVVWAGLGQARADVRWSPVGYDVVDDRGVEVTYDLGKNPAATAVCTLQAMDRNKSTVGIAEVTIGPTAQRVTRRTDVVRTSALAVTGIVHECRLR